MFKTLLVIVVVAAAVYFGFPYVQQGYYAVRYPTTSEYTNQSIDPSVEPIQGSTSEDAFFVTDRKGRNVQILPIASYDIQARVVINRGLPRYDVKSPLGDVLTNDLVLVWGRVAQEENVKKIKFSHQFTYMTFKYNDRDLHEELGLDYISSHVSSNHLIAANSNIDHALRRLRKNDIVRIRGHLVNIQIPDFPTLQAFKARSFSLANELGPV